MKKEEMESLLKDSKYNNWAEHMPLINLSCIFDLYDEYENGVVGDFEVLFIVPIPWLKKYLEEDTGEEWSDEKLRDWLVNEYTSEDSQPILEQAIYEKQIAFWEVE